MATKDFSDGADLLVEGIPKQRVHLLAEWLDTKSWGYAVKITVYPTEDITKVTLCICSNSHFITWDSVMKPQIIQHLTDCKIKTSLDIVNC
jgi:hypothetical protein